MSGTSFYLSVWVLAFVLWYLFCVAYGSGCISVFSGLVPSFFFFFGFLAVRCCFGWAWLLCVAVLIVCGLCLLVGFLGVCALSLLVEFLLFAALSAHVFVVVCSVSLWMFL